MRVRVLPLLFVASALLAVIPRRWASETPPCDKGSFEWPAEFEGKTLVEEPLTGFEKDFADKFPGRIGRFRAGADVVIMRHVTKATHRVHSAAVCLAAKGWDVSPMPLVRRDDGDWSAFRAEKDGLVLEVREQIRAADGSTIPDVALWFRTAFLGRSVGPWLAVSVVSVR